MAGTDRLVFRGPPTDFHAGWAGPWPPPERLTVVTGAVSGQLAVVDLATLPSALAGFLEDLIAAGSTVAHFRLAGASSVLEPAEPDANWFRGAEYLPEPPAAADTAVQEDPMADPSVPCAFIDAEGGRS